MNRFVQGNDIAGGRIVVAILGGIIFFGRKPLVVKSIKNDFICLCGIAAKGI